ncbi:MAG: hypothetical protein ACM3WT_02115 [Bacillota bacterium]
MFTSAMMGFRKVRRTMMVWMMFWVAISVLFAVWTYSIQESLGRIADYFELKSRKYSED